MGKFRDDWADWQTLVLDGELVLLDPSQPDPLPGACKLVPVAEHTFRIETENGYGNDGELVIFEMDEQGRVRRARVGANYVYPLADW